MNGKLPEGGPLNLDLNLRSFGPQQQLELLQALNAYMETLCRVAPRLAPHFLSGGTIEIKTLSGAYLKFGFSPQSGGLILPGGLTPRPDLGRPK